MPKTGQKNALPRGDATEMLVGMAAVPMPKLEPSVIPNLEDEFEADAEEESVAGFDSDESPVCSPGLYPGLCP